ncbi:MAG: threonine/serine dehydratase [Candidatus Bathyarchaeota archaeon]|nr:MAG: threonine/serine dehydratase [Candidatus Bathyarchaeota archaeon]
METSTCYAEIHGTRKAYTHVHLQPDGRMIHLKDIEQARESISELVRKTPLKRSALLSSLCGGEVYLKLENQQLTNSFKIRGAYNRLKQLKREEVERGVITASAGNHGLAVALSAERLKIHATIVVPRTTPQVKVDRIRRHNVELLLEGGIYDEAEQKAITLAKEREITYISPYNDDAIITGQGSIGLEIHEDIEGLRRVLVPVGGGGLISGVSIALKAIDPAIGISGVQSTACPVMYESLRAGEIVHPEMTESIADGLYGGIEAGSITFGIVCDLVDEIILVKEKSIRQAIYMLWENEKQIVEGAGAVGVAALMENPDVFEGETVVIIVSGGNIEREELERILAEKKAWNHCKTWEKWEGR